MGTSICALLTGSLSASGFPSLADQEYVAISAAACSAGLLPAPSSTTSPLLSEIAMMAFGTSRSFCWMVFICENSSCPSGRVQIATSSFWPCLSGMLAEKAGIPPGPLPKAAGNSLPFARMASLWQSAPPARRATTFFCQVQTSPRVTSRTRLPGGSVGTSVGPVAEMGDLPPHPPSPALAAVRRQSRKKSLRLSGSRGMAALLHARQGNAANEVFLEEQEDKQDRQRRDHRACEDDIPDGAVLDDEQRQAELEGSQLRAADHDQ